MLRNDISDFWDASDEALFSQKTIASVLQVSEAKLERDRWRGCGIPFLKLGKIVRYSKKDVLNWLQKFAPVISTSEYSESAPSGGEL